MFAIHGRAQMLEFVAGGTADLAAADRDRHRSAFGGNTSGLESDFDYRLRANDVAEREELGTDVLQ